MYSLIDNDCKWDWNKHKKKFDEKKHKMKYSRKQFDLEDKLKLWKFKADEYIDYEEMPLKMQCLCGKVLERAKGRYKYIKHHVMCSTFIDDCYSGIMKLKDFVGSFQKDYDKHKLKKLLREYLKDVRVYHKKESQEKVNERIKKINDKGVKRKFHADPNHHFDCNVSFELFDEADVLVKKRHENN